MRGSKRCLKQRYGCGSLAASSSATFRPRAESEPAGRGSRESIHDFAKSCGSDDQRHTLGLQRGASPWCSDGEYPASEGHLQTSCLGDCRSFRQVQPSGKWRCRRRSADMNKDTGIFGKQWSLGSFPITLAILHLIIWGLAVLA